jgi:hypothetical protein
VGIAPTKNILQVPLYIAGEAAYVQGFSAAAKGSRAQKNRTMMPPDLYYAVWSVKELCQSDDFA